MQDDTYGNMHYNCKQSKPIYFKLYFGMKHNIKYVWNNATNNLGYCTIRMGHSAIDPSSYEINTLLRNNNLIAKVIVQLANNVQVQLANNLLYIREN